MSRRDPAFWSSWCAVLGAGLVGLCGCKVGPDYAEPDAATPGAWSSELEQGVTAESHPRLERWWESLSDPTLDGLVTRAVIGNLDLREAEARVREARALRGAAASDRLPQVDAAAGYARRRESENGFIRSADDDDDGTDLWSAGFDASWEIDVFGRVKRSVEAADADVAAAEEGRRDVLVSLVAEVARNYVEARSFQARLAIAHTNVKSQEDSLSLTRSLFEAGLTSELDPARAAANLASTRAAIPSLETGYRTAVHRLGVLLGQTPGSLRDELEVAAPVPGAPTAIPVGVPSDLLRRRPDIRRAEREIAASTARVGVATADLFPRFSLTGSFGMESTEIGDLPEGDSVFWSIGPSMRWSIFNGGRVRALIGAADARQEQAAARYELAVLTALEDVENALVAYAREQARRARLGEAVASEQRAVELAQELYDARVTDFLTVLDAQRELYALQDQMAESEGRVTLSVVALCKALGGGWDEGVSAGEQGEAGAVGKETPNDL